MNFTIENVNVINEDFGELQNNFWINLQIDISNNYSSGSETFNLNLVSVERLRIISENGPLLCRGLIVCNEYNISDATKIINNILKGISALNWEDFCVEFEKYFERL